MGSVTELILGRSTYPLPIVRPPHDSQKHALAQEKSTAGTTAK